MAAMRDPRATGRRRDLGQSVVEMALILPIFLSICLGILDLGRAFYTYERIQNAAREGAAWLSLRPTASAAAVAARVQSEGVACAGGQGVQVTSPGGGFTGADRVNVDNNGNVVLAADGQHVQVTVSCPFDLVTPFMGRVLSSTPPCSTLMGISLCQPGGPLILRGRALMPVVWSGG